MTQILLFHHAQGLTPGVREFADLLRAGGHEVTVPDLYDGATFDSVEEGVAHAEEIGFDNLLGRADRAAADLPSDVVYAGFSLGALAAHRLTQTRPGARGALLYHHGDVPLGMFGDAWPAGTHLQIHVNQGDPFYEPDVVEEFIRRAGASATAELFVYPGTNHLFADSSLPEYEAESAAMLIERTLGFLDRLARAGRTPESLA